MKHRKKRFERVDVAGNSSGYLASHRMSCNKWKIDQPCKCTSDDVRLLAQTAATYVTRSRTKTGGLLHCSPEIGTGTTGTQGFSLEIFINKFL